MKLTQGKCHKHGQVELSVGPNIRLPVTIQKITLQTSIVVAMLSLRAPGEAMSCSPTSQAEATRDHEARRVPGVCWCVWPEALMLSKRTLSRYGTLTMGCGAGGGNPASDITNPAMEPGKTTHKRTKYRRDKERAQRAAI